MMTLRETIVTISWSFFRLVKPIGCRHEFHVKSSRVKSFSQIVVQRSKIIFAIFVNYCCFICCRYTSFYMRTFLRMQILLHFPCQEHNPLKLEIYDHAMQEKIFFNFIIVSIAVLFLKWVLIKKIVRWYYWHASCHPPKKDLNWGSAGSECWCGSGKNKRIN